MSKQTRKAYLAESMMNVAVGYCLSVATTAIALPWLFGFTSQFPATSSSV
jgi:hypothetical protein